MRNGPRRGGEGAPDEAPDVAKIMGVEVCESAGEVVGDSDVVRIEHEVAEGDMDGEERGREEEPQQQRMRHDGTINLCPHSPTSSSPPCSSPPSSPSSSSPSSSPLKAPPTTSSSNSQRQATASFVSTSTHSTSSPLPSAPGLPPFSSPRSTHSADVRHASQYLSPLVPQFN